MNEHIFLVEDEIEIAQLTQEFLENNGYQVTLSFDGQDAMERYQELKPDLIILDVMLPKMDGMEVCRKIRSHYNGPIMMLTSRNDQIDEVLGLELGADDYVLKTTEPRIVLARAKALLRRRNLYEEPVQVVESILDFGSVYIDFGMREVKVFNKAIELSNPEFELLGILARNAGNVMTRERIFENMRGIQYDGQNRLIDITVSQLRGKLDSADRIKTVRTKGYQFTNLIVN
ncbi:MAG: response regulator transcription factor [Saccharospirillaceae bacterium]|nr:response regulator transcription factor [Pseudomonadales bacterium]NRB77552.1 response regulator transcription factor [Saccharospirillaceae bacterium]